MRIGIDIDIDDTLTDIKAQVYIIAELKQL